MERLSNTKKSGINGNALRTWGLLFLTVGVIGRGVIQRHILGIGDITAQQLLEVMNSSSGAMGLATLSLVLQAMETCAAPIFALLLVEGFQHTSGFGRYLLRVVGTALLAEIPYNMLIGGSVIAPESRNPVFGMVLGLVILYFYQRYAEKTAKDILIKVVVTIAGILWAQMLRIEFGACMVLVIWALWTFRKNPLTRNFAGAVVTIVCTLFSLFFLAAPMGFLVVHTYNGEESTTPRVVNYLAYPAILLVLGLIGMVLL